MRWLSIGESSVSNSVAKAKSVWTSIYQTCARRARSPCCAHADITVLPNLTSSILLMQLKADVTYFRRQLGGGPSVDIVDLACSLTHLGHEVKVRYAEGGGPNCFRNLFHEFLLVKVRFRAMVSLYSSLELCPYLHCADSNPLQHQLSAESCSFE